MQAARITIGLTLLAAGFPGLSSAIGLEPDTLKAWEDYIRNADSRMQIAGVSDYIQSVRDFWVARSSLDAALAGSAPRF